jgi:hypothetical protein
LSAALRGLVASNKVLCSIYKFRPAKVTKDKHQAAINELDNLTCYNTTCVPLLGTFIMYVSLV